MYRPTLTEPAAILPCCRDGEPYVGVDQFCTEEAIFCLQHSSHQGVDGLMHQMMPLRQFKRIVNEKKFSMQEKVGQLIENYNSFMDNLISEIKELKLRKSLQLGMLWLRELANNEDEYELMKKVHRMDFAGLTCQKLHSIYKKIIHNQHLEKKSIYEMDCYKGMTAILEKLGDNPTAKAKICEKITDIEGLVEDGKILKKFLPDKRTANQKVSEVILEESHDKNYNIRYHTAELATSSKSYMSLFSKYPLLSNTTYHLTIKTKYANMMFGICGQSVKQSRNEDLHYHKNSLVYNCSNGCIYSDGMFRSSLIRPIFKNVREITVKIKLTTEEMIIFTKSETLVREEFANIKGKIYLHLLGRTKTDYIQVERDKDGNENNIQLENTIQQEEEEQGESQVFINHGTVDNIPQVSATKLEQVPEIIVQEQKGTPKSITSDDFLTKIKSNIKGQMNKKKEQNSLKRPSEELSEKKSSRSEEQIKVELRESKIKPMASIDQNFYPTTMKSNDGGQQSQVRLEGIEERGESEMHLTNYFSSLSEHKIKSDRSAQSALSGQSGQSGISGQSGLSGLNGQNALSAQSGQEEYQNRFLPVYEASEINIDIPPSFKTNMNSEYEIGRKIQKKGMKLPKLNHFGFSKFSVQSSDINQDEQNIFGKNVASYNIMKEPEKQITHSLANYGKQEKQEGEREPLSKRDSDQSNFNATKNDSTKYYFNSRGSQLMKVHISKIKQKK